MHEITELSISIPPTIKRTFRIRGRDGTAQRSRGGTASQLSRLWSRGWVGAAAAALLRRLRHSTQEHSRDGGSAREQDHTSGVRDEESAVAGVGGRDGRSSPEESSSATRPPFPTRSPLPRPPTARPPTARPGSQRPSDLGRSAFDMGCLLALVEPCDRGFGLLKNARTALARSALM